MNAYVTLNVKVMCSSTHKPKQHLSLSSSTLTFHIIEIICQVSTLKSSSTTLPASTKTALTFRSSSFPQKNQRNLTEDLRMSESPLDTFLNSSPPLKDFALRFKGHYKSSSVWTLEGGCLLFTSWMVYYLLFKSPEVRGVLDLIVLIFFFIGVALFFATSSFFSALSRNFGGSDPSSPSSSSSSSSSNWTYYLSAANRYIFMALSFIPGVYFAFKYEHFITTPYLFIHVGTIAYFFYKRFREFELEPFLIGLGMSAGLFCVGPVLRTILGQGFGGFLETLLDLGLAVAFLLQLPQKHLPPNMMFGLKLVKYLMCFLSWQTWYILMIFATWNNLGAAAQAAVETYKAIPVPSGEGAASSRKTN